MAEKDIRESIGYTSATGYFMPQWNIKAIGEVSELLFEGFCKDKFHQLCEDLGLSGENKPVKKMSDGMRMETALAAVFARETKCLLLDEPAAGMNPHETEDLAKTIRFIRDHFDMTVLLIEHDMNFVSDLCDEVTVLNFGTVLAQGDTKTVLQDPEVIKAYIGG